MSSEFALVIVSMYGQAYDERRAQIDETVRIAAQRRYRQWGADAEYAILRKMALTNTVYVGMAYEVSKAWRDIQARHERA